MLKKIVKERNLDFLANISISLAERLKVMKRTEVYSQKPYPKHDSYEYYFLNHTGNFWEGFLINTGTNITIDILSQYASSKLKQGKIKNIADKLQNNKYIPLAISTGVTISTICLDEIYGLFTTPDIKDIPAGIIGALGYVGLRAYSIYKEKNN